MSKIVNLRRRDGANRPDIEAEARAWVIRFDGDEPPDRVAQQEFRAWLGTSPLHRQVFKDTVSVWHDLDRWSDYLSPQGVADTGGAQSRALWSWSGRGAKRFAGAAATLLLLGASVILVSHWEPRLLRPTGFTQEYATAVGEIRAVVLPDGSRMQLDTRTRVSVAYSNSARVISLTEGDAYFSVAHDPRKPFLVYAGRYAVKAVGTAFSVRMQGRNLDLTVTEGRVQVASLEAPIVAVPVSDLTQLKNVTSLVPVAGGQKIAFKGEEETVERVEPAAVEKDLSWRDGMLIFDNDPLEDVVSRINRYTNIRIVISDASIRGLKFGGYFKVGDVPAILDTMNQSFGLRVEKVGERLVYVSRR